MPTRHMHGCTSHLPRRRRLRSVVPSPPCAKRPRPNEALSVVCRPVPPRRAGGGRWRGGRAQGGGPAWRAGAGHGERAHAHAAAAALGGGRTHRASPRCVPGGLAGARLAGGGGDFRCRIEPADRHVRRAAADLRQRGRRRGPVEFPRAGGGGPRAADHRDLQRRRGADAGAAAARAAGGAARPFAGRAGHAGGASAPAHPPAPSGPRGAAALLRKPVRRPGGSLAAPGAAG